MKIIPFILVTGFLGSGKTTLLKRFLNCFADQKRIVVIQNEFAPANIDGQALRETGKSFEILEINKGSVFCVCQLSNFVQSLIEVTDTFQPDIVILEATGLADPIAIGQLLSAPDLSRRLYLSHVWCVVDAASFLEMEPRVQRMRHQVRIADTIILNKTDLVSRDRLDQTEKRLIDLNPFADRVPSQLCDLSDSELGRAILAGPEDRRHQNHIGDIQSAGAPDVSSAVLRTTHPVSKENLMRFLQHHQKKAYRIKGNVNLTDKTTVSVQFCFGRIEIRAIEKEPSPTELIALGPEIDQEAFTSLFMKLSSK